MTPDKLRPRVDRRAAPRPEGDAALRTGARGGPRTRIQARNEELILDAALDAFSAYGYRGATVDQIAGGAGISKANVLYYFRRKEDMYRAVLERTLALWLDPFEKIDAGGDPIEEIWRYAQTKLRLSRESPRASRLFVNEMLHGAPVIGDYLRGGMRELFETKCRVIRGWIDAGRIAPVEPLHLIMLIWSVTQHYADFEPQVEALHDGGRDRLFDGAERTLRLILERGLRPADPPSPAPTSRGRPVKG